MTNKYFSLCIISLALLVFSMWTPLVAGIGLKAKLSSSSSDITLDLTNEAGMNDASSGKCYSLPKGAKVYIKLSQNPSTGYSYYIKEPKIDLLNQAYIIAEDFYQAAATNGNMVGGGGVRTIQLWTTQKAQKSYFDFAYVAPGLFEGWSADAMKNYKVFHICLTIT